MFEEYISLPEHDMLAPSEEQKRQLDAFIDSNPEEACGFIDRCYEATTGIYLLDTTGDEVPEICVSGWAGNGVSNGLTDLGSDTIVVLDGTYRMIEMAYIF